MRRALKSRLLPRDGLLRRQLYPQYLVDYPSRTLNPMRLAQPPVLLMASAPAAAGNAWQA